ncbi:hypothetical protein AAVH_18878 [Aphelenchoides avenae]|nr:hypothetical protein AAVH_18878 [Aphelenchus avenae]
MMFAGTWYCYPLLVIPSGQASVDIIRNNYCAQSLPGSNVVKIDEDREYGYMYWWWSETDVYLGLHQQSGTTFVW